MTTIDPAARETVGEYKWGFHDEVQPLFMAEKGLSEDLVRYISKTKDEPKWMLDFRLDALRTPEIGVLIITHYQRILNYITPDVEHVLVDGRIVRSGDAELAKQIEAEGYEPLLKEIDSMEEVAS